MNWKDITLSKYYKIVDIMAVQDDYTALNLIDLIYGINSGDINIWELGKYDITFLKEPIPTGDMPKKLELNGHVYRFDGDLTRITAAQYVDFTNYTKTKDIKFEDVLSVFCIPEGMKYNDGYLISDVKKDILELDMVTIQTMAQFFFRQFELFSEIFRLYLLKFLSKEMKTAQGEKKEKLKEAITKLEETDFPNLASFLTLSRTVV